MVFSRWYTVKMQGPQMVRDQKKFGNRCLKATAASSKLTRSCYWEALKHHSYDTVSIFSDCFQWKKRACITWRRWTVALFESKSQWAVWKQGRDASRVARLAFLRPNSRNLVFLKVVWHEKMVFGMYVIVWHFFGLFDGVGMKKHCLTFFKTSGSISAIDLEL